MSGQIYARLIGDFPSPPPLFRVTGDVLEAVVGTEGASFIRATDRALFFRQIDLDGTGRLQRLDVVTSTIETVLEDFSPWPSAVVVDDEGAAWVDGDGHLMHTRFDGTTAETVDLQDSSPLRLALGPDLVYFAIGCDDDPDTDCSVFAVAR